MHSRRCCIRFRKRASVYHSQRNHFSRWLMASTEFALAQKLRPRKVSDFARLEDLRRDLIESIDEYRREQSEVLIGDFDAATFQDRRSILPADRGGSLGGKARGLAFIRHLLHKQRIFTALCGSQNYGAAGAGAQRPMYSTAF